jgi:hypothetical protein
LLYTGNILTLIAIEDFPGNLSNKLLSQKT